MRLYGTPPSHFTRKVRVVLQELRVPYEFVHIANLLEVGEEHFAHNPLHMFPVLEDGDLRLFESDLICDYLISRFGKNAELSTFLPIEENKIRDLQRMAVMNGGMSAGVTLIRAKRSGIQDWNAHAYFRQELAAIDSALRWLEQEIPSPEGFYPGRITMPDITLMCFLQWAEFREFLKSWAPYPSLERFVRAHAERPAFRSTHPSIQEAKL